MKKAGEPRGRSRGCTPFRQTAPANQPRFRTWETVDSRIRGHIDGAQAIVPIVRVAHRSTDFDDENGIVFDKPTGIVGDDANGRSTGSVIRELSSVLKVVKLT